MHKTLVIKENNDEHHFGFAMYALGVHYLVMVRKGDYLGFKVITVDPHRIMFYDIFKVSLLSVLSSKLEATGKQFSFCSYISGCGTNLRCHPQIC